MLGAVCDGGRPHVPRWGGAAVIRLSLLNQKRKRYRHRSDPVNQIHEVFPYLRVRDGAAALDYYQRAFGARVRLRLDEAGTGRVGHAEMEIGPMVVMLSDEYPESASSVRRHLAVPVCRFICMSTMPMRCWLKPLRQAEPCCARRPTRFTASAVAPSVTRLDMNG